MTIHVALGQIAARETASDTLATIGAIARQAARAGAALLALPEGVIGPFAQARGIAESLDGPFASGVRRLSGELGIAIVVGSFLRKLSMLG